MPLSTTTVRCVPLVVVEVVTVLVTEPFGLMVWVVVTVVVGVVVVVTVVTVGPLVMVDVLTTGRHGMVGGGGGGGGLPVDCRRACSDGPQGHGLRRQFVSASRDDFVTVPQS